MGRTVLRKERPLHNLSRCINNLDFGEHFCIVYIQSIQKWRMYIVNQYADLQQSATVGSLNSGNIKDDKFFLNIIFAFQV